MDQDLTYVLDDPYGSSYFYMLDIQETKENSYPTKKRIDNLEKEGTYYPQIYFINRIDNVDRSFIVNDFLTFKNVKDLQKIDYLKTKED